MKEKSLGINVVINVIRNVVNIIFPLITFPYASRALGVNSIGIYNFSYSIVSYFLLIAALGISTYAIREGARYRNNKELLTEFASEIFSINMLSTIITYILMIVVLVNCKSIEKYIVTILIFSIQIFFTTIGVEWLFTICEEFSYITIVNMIFKVISVFLLFLFVRNQNDYNQYAAITVFAILGSNIFNMIHMRKRIKYKIVFRMNIKKHILPIMIIFASNIAVAIYVNMDVTMLGFMCNDYSVGIYSVAVKVYNVVKNILAAILIVYIPRLSASIGNNKRNEFKILANKVFNMVTMFLVPAVIGIIIFAKEIVLLVGGAEYERAKTALRILGVALFFAIFSWLFSQCILIPLKLERKVLMATIISAVVNVVLNLFLIPVWHENAAALTTVVSEFFSVVICGYYAIEYFKKENIVKNIAKVMLSSLFMTLLVCVLKKNMNSIITSIVCGGSIGALVYFVCLKILKYESIEELVNKFKYKIKSERKKK